MIITLIKGIIFKLILLGNLIHNIFVNFYFNLTSITLMFGYKAVEWITFEMCIPFSTFDNAFFSLNVASVN